MESTSSASSPMDKVELIQQTIHKLITDDSSDSDSDGNEVNKSGEQNRRGRRRLVLTGLLSQLESIRAAEKHQKSEISCDAEEIACADGDVEHIDEPLNKTEVGSCVLTITWQISEVSLLLWLKNGVTHPVRSFGSLVKGMLIPNSGNKEKQQSFTKEKFNSTKDKFIELLKQSSTRDKLIESLQTIKQSSARDKLIEALEAIESSPIQGIKIPELLRMELPSFDSSNDEA
ncbi:hypothetical protein POM88_032308 [Heracleum sosnowskyi]|uniref:Uncharacterized protein n=1 Tax=Heracleum sosnowskyi TaxID=360622 RepID=A0AAD8HZW2_9APIA|nr:hypothetical protein POM88_032308 [Heracleum sosnowskyi]